MKKINPKIPVIFCTEHSTVLTEEKNRTIGIDRYINKPITDNELSDAIRLLLDKK